MTTVYKTLKDFIKSQFVFKFLPNIDDPYVVLVSASKIVTIGHGTVNQTSLSNDNNLVEQCIKAFEHINNRQEIESEYNFKFMYINGKPCLINNSYIDSITNRQVVQTEKYLKFNNGQDIII